MAITPTYEHSATMKKLNVNGSIYWLKDADLRAIVEGFGNSVYKDCVTVFDDKGADIATEAAIAAYVEDKIKGLEGAMHFMGVVERAEGQTDAQAIAAFYAAKSLTPKAGDVVIMKDNGKEYIHNGTAWEEIGDQNIYLTIAEAAATYVPKTLTIAGIDLQDNITVAEMETALDLKALAHKASASGSVEVVDTADDITSGKAGTYTVAGSTVAVPVTYNALDVTPGGTIDVNPGTAASATYDKVSSIAVSSSTPTEGQTANYTPAGSVTLPGLSTSVTLSPTNVATVTDAGTAYSLSDGSVVKADDTTAKFVKKGVSFAMDETDTEQLNLSYVVNSNTEFYTDAVTAAGDITYTKQTLTGALPTFGTQAVALTTGVVASSDYTGNASFTGTGAMLSADASFSTESASVIQPTFTADFNPVTKTVTPTVATTADAQAPEGTITVPSETISISLNKKTSTVTVE